MANDDRQSQQFIREVDEELRRAQLKSLWDRFAPLIIGVCVLIVAITAGYRGWIWWQARQAAEAGDRYVAAVQALEGGSTAEGEAALAQIIEERSEGYAALARLRLAGQKAAAGAKPEALAGFDAVAEDATVAESLRALARTRAALIALDIGDVAGARQRAEPLNVAGSPWRHAAREVLGTAAYQSGDLQGAREAFTAIQEDAETPSDIWVRSGMMVSLIDGQLAAPGSAAGPATTPEAAAPEPQGAAPPVAPGPDAAPQPSPATAGPATLPVPANEQPVFTTTSAPGDPPLAPSSGEAAVPAPAGQPPAAQPAPAAAPAPASPPPTSPPPASPLPAAAPPAISPPAPQQGAEPAGTVAPAAPLSPPEQPEPVIPPQ